jgi:hypothetical protein
MISQQELTEEYSLQAAYDERRKSHQFLVRLDCADLEDTHEFDSSIDEDSIFRSC